MVRISYDNASCFESEKIPHNKLIKGQGRIDGLLGPNLAVDKRNS